MNIELLLLIVLASLTLLAYIVALNSHGTTRLAVSYLMATVILVGCVWATVQYVNTGDNRKKVEELRRLETEKEKAEAQVSSQQVALRENKERLVLATRLNAIITRALSISSSISNVNLRDPNQELDVLISKSAEIKRKTEEIILDYEKLKLTDSVFMESSTIVKEALKQLLEASQYYTLYYRAEDGSQEELRERIMRQKATGVHDLLQKASGLIASSNGQ